MDSLVVHLMTDRIVEYRATHWMFEGPWLVICYGDSSKTVIPANSIRSVSITEDDES